MRLLQYFLKNNLFFFKGEHAKPINSCGTSKKDTQFHESMLPIVIIAREHYQEVTKTFPISDKGDVKNIIENEFGQLKVVSIEQNDLTSSTAKLYVLDEVAEKFVLANTCIYIPETYLSGFLADSQLTLVDRCDVKLNLIRKGDKTYSAISANLYANSDVFLYSSGAGEAISTISLEEGTYFDKLIQQILQLKPKDLHVLFGGQNFYKKLLENLHLPSLLIGATCSILLYWGGMFAELSLRKFLLPDEIQSNELREVIELKRKYEDKLEYMERLNKAGTEALPSRTVWEIFVMLLENNISVGSAVYEKGGLKLGILAPSSTETISLLRRSPFVTEVTLDGDIMEMDGKQSFNVYMSVSEGGDNE